MLIPHQGRGRAARNLAVRQSYLILFGQAPAPTPTSDALPRQVHRLETEEDTMCDRMTKRDIEQVVLNMLPAEPGASISALSQIAGVASDRVSRVLMKLEQDGKVRREEMAHGQVVVKRWFLTAPLPEGRGFPLHRTEPIRT